MRWYESLIVTETDALQSQDEKQPAIISAVDVKPEEAGSFWSKLLGRPRKGAIPSDEADERSSSESINITSFELSPNRAKQGEKVKALVSLVSDSQGVIVQKYELKLEGEVLSVQEITLGPGEHRGLIFDFDTAHILPGEHQISLKWLHKRLDIITEIKSDSWLSA